MIVTPDRRLRVFVSSTLDELQIPLGVTQAMSGDHGAGIALLEDSRARAEQLQSEWGVAMSMLALTCALNAAGAEAPLEVFEETVERGRSLGFESETVALGALARRRALRGDVPEAKELLAEVLDRVVRLDVRLGIGLYVDLLADLAAREKKHRLAARRSGGAEAVFAAAAAPITPLVGDRAARLALLRERLGDASFEAETAAGRNGGPEQAVAEALAWARA